MKNTFAFMSKTERLRDKFLVKNKAKKTDEFRFSRTISSP